MLHTHKNHKKEICILKKSLTDNTSLELKTAYISIFLKLFKIKIVHFIARLKLPAIQIENDIIKSYCYDVNWQAIRNALILLFAYGLQH